MTKRKVEIRRPKCNTLGGKFTIDSPVCQIVVDGSFVGYCTPKADPGTVNITVECPKEVVDEVKHHVSRFWESMVTEVSTLPSLEEENEDEGELDA